MLFLILRLLYTKIKHKRKAREGEKEHKRCNKSVRCCSQACAGGGDEGCGEEVEVYDAVVRCEIFLSVKCRCERRSDRGACAVGKSDEAETDDAEGEGIADYRKERHSRREDREEICSDHGKASARSVKEHTGEDSSESVASRKHSYESRCKRGGCSRRECEILCEADNRISDCDKAHHVNKAYPERGAREHLKRGYILDFEAFRLFCLYLFRLGECYIRRGLAQDDSRKADHCRHDDSEEKKSLSPSDCLVREKSIEQRTEDERGHAESHQETARTEAALVGEPCVYRGDDDVICDSDAESREDGVGDVKNDNVGVHEGSNNKSAAREDSRRDQRKICSDCLCNAASEKSADAEGAHRQGEIEREFCVTPTELVGKRNFEYRPCVDDARKGETDGAEREIKPAQREP